MERRSGAALWGLLLVLGIAACATVPAAPNASGLYAMPEDPADAISPSQADPDDAGQLAESALYLLNPGRPGGPDYLGAARMCLLAAEMADPEIETDLERACYRVAARSALRSGDRTTYIEAVDRWDVRASRSERTAGELAIHLAIRDRLENEPRGRGVRVPPAVRRLIPPPDGGP